MEDFVKGGGPQGLWEQILWLKEEAVDLVQLQWVPLQLEVEGNDVAGEMASPRHKWHLNDELPSPPLTPTPCYPPPPPGDRHFNFFHIYYGGLCCPSVTHNIVLVSHFFKSRVGRPGVGTHGVS